VEGDLHQGADAGLQSDVKLVGERAVQRKQGTVDADGDRSREDLS
jgi:hypothetical protein